MLPKVLVKLAVLLCLLIFETVAWAESIPSSYQQIAIEYKIPSAVLYGIALAESGKKLRSGRLKPWPWTLNVAGVPRRYASRKAAYRGLQLFLQQGITSIDIGLMQVNWRYHRKKLGTPWEALEPFHNVRTGANILRRQYKQTGLWQTAIGRYHSPGQKNQQKKRATRYAKRVMQHVKRLKRKKRSS